MCAVDSTFPIIVVCTLIRKYRSHREYRDVPAATQQSTHDSRSRGLSATRARARLGLTIQGAANEANIHPSLLRRYERGTLQLKSEELRRLGAVYGTDLL